MSSPNHLGQQPPTPEASPQAIQRGRLVRTVGPIVVAHEINSPVARFGDIKDRLVTMKHIALKPTPESPQPMPDPIEAEAMAAMRNPNRRQI